MLAVSLMYGFSRRATPRQCHARAVVSLAFVTALDFPARAVMAGGAFVVDTLPA
jgi:hypothetical protein